MGRVVSKALISPNFFRNFVYANTLFMYFFSTKFFFIILITTTILIGGIFSALNNESPLSTKKAEVILDVQEDILTSSVDEAPLPPTPPLSPKKLANQPEIIKAVYVTGWSAGSKSYLNYLSNLFENTEINAVVIDIKDYSGTISYIADAPEAKKYNLYNYAISDIDSLVRFFHNKNIYVIARISVFEDPAYAKARPELAVYDAEKTLFAKLAIDPKTGTTEQNDSGPVLWEDNNRLSWLDPASTEVWDYNISLAKDVFYHGFDEVNFDYIRFPSDGDTKNMGFPVWDEKTPLSKIIKEFFAYLRKELDGEVISADLFGQTTVNRDDMGIGQILEDAFLNFDYISPMVYPSHYANGFIGFENPAEHPYEVVKYSMNSALLRKRIYFNKMKEAILGEGSEGAEIPSAIEIKLAKFRPWLQDFNMGADYTAEMVQQEIQATKDSLGEEFKGFMLWNPSNVYTWGAIQK